MTDATHTLFSVIIPTWRDWVQLERCLAAIAVQTVPADRIEVIVANNDPASACPFPLAANVRMITVDAPGSYAARNAAVAGARGRTLAFTDSDCVPSPDWLAQAAAALDDAPDARITGPVTIFRAPGGGYYAWLYEFHTAFRQRESAARGECVTANLIVTRAVFDRVGLFDATMMSGGDVAWNRRAGVAGVPLLYREEVLVMHPARESIRAIIRKKRRIGGSQLWTRHLSYLALARRIVKPPLGALRDFDRAPVATRDRAPLLAIMWLLRIAETTETMLVRAGLKRPLRS